MNPIRFNERWLPITSKSVPNVAENMYMISERGRAYSLSRNIFLAQVPTWNGYYRINLRLNSGEGRYFFIHRIVMLEFNYIEDYNKYQVNHIDGNKANNNLYNLEWVTPSQNIIHAYRTGLKVKEKGEDCSYSTITNHQAEEIAKMILSNQYTYREISNIIGCSRSVVEGIANGSNWKDIYNKYNLESRKNKSFKLRLCDQDLHKLCKFWQDNKIYFSTNSDLFRYSLKELFNIDYDNSMSATLSRLYNHQTRKEIVDQYNF